MALRSWSVLTFVLSLLVFRVVADQTVTIDGADPQIKRYSNENGSNSPTWLVINRSPDTCDTPQQLTERVGDYATFAFTGTGIEILGTVGVKRGLIGISFDGLNTTFDRTAPQKVCDAILFKKTGLPLQQHTVVLSLDQKQISLVNGQEVGVLSLQRIRYTIPGGPSSSSKTPIIIGIVVGVLALTAGIAVLLFFLRRRRQKVKNISNHTFFDADDVIPGSRPTPGQIVTELNTGFIASPFSWAGPGSQHTQQQQQPQQEQQSQYSQSQYHQSQYAQRPATTYYGGDSNPSSPTPQQPLLYPAEAGPSAYPTGAAMRDSQSHSSNSRDRKMRESGQGNYYLNNPDRASNSGSYIGHSGGVDDDTLVDRIANRLADIMGARVGMPVNIADMVPPPVYEGRPEDEVADFQRRIEKRMEHIQQERRGGPSTAPSAWDSSAPGGTQPTYTTSSGPTGPGSRSQYSSPPTSVPATQQTFPSPPLSPPPVFDTQEAYPQYAYNYEQQIQQHRSPPTSPSITLPPGAAIPARGPIGTATTYAPPPPETGNNGNGRMMGPRQPNKGNRM